jgi:hypothetical protein
VPETSRVVVGEIDQLESSGFSTVVSISVTGVRLSDPDTGEIRQEAVYHCPIMAETLAGCVIARDGVGETADGFEEGYARWRQSLEDGEGGFFSIPVNEIVELYRGLYSPDGSTK